MPAVLVAGLMMMITATADCALSCSSTCCVGEGTDVLDYIKHYEHMVKGDIFAVYDTLHPSRLFSAIMTIAISLCTIALC